MQNPSDNQGKLVRSIGLTSAIVLVISSVIGTGVFKKLPQCRPNYSRQDLSLPHGW
jgi:hypothetical protein